MVGRHAGSRPVAGKLGKIAKPSFGREISKFPTDNSGSWFGVGGGNNGGVDRGIQLVGVEAWGGVSSWFSGGGGVDNVSGWFSGDGGGG